MSCPRRIADEYRYYPEKMNLEINIDTQSVLMDALRIYDEKMRDGELHEDDVRRIRFGTLPVQEETAPTISADDLGLADFDRLERKTADGIQVSGRRGPLQASQPENRGNRAGAFR